MCYKTKETSRCEIVYKLMNCQIGDTPIWREVSHNCMFCPVDYKLTNMDRSESFLLQHINVCGVTWITSPNFETDKIPQLSRNS